MAYTEEEQQLISRAGEYERLVGLPAWKLALDFLARLEDDALSAMRQNLSSDPEVARNLAFRWQERGFVLERLQDEVLGTIEQRDELLRIRQEDGED